LRLTPRIAPVCLVAPQRQPHIPLDVLTDTIQPFPTFSEIYVNTLKVLRDEIAAAFKAVGAGPMAS
jgi:hypothetical protein